MMWKNLNSVYFVGIGGIGMSALARFFVARNKNVSGYDRTSTSLTDQLTREGIDIHFIDDAALIPEEFRNPDSTLVIYTPAVPENLQELQYFRNKGFRVMKRSAALGHVFNAGFGIGVAGTHGKTSVSTILAHVLSDSEYGCSAFLGGISKNFNSNLHIHPTSEVIIAEADEYDRSFLALYPSIAVITSMDDDHLDIYENSESLKKAFEQYITQISENGKLIINYGLPADLPAHVSKLTYSIDNVDADYHLKKLEMRSGYYHFIVKTPADLHEFTLGIPGKINVENALAAIAVADQLGISMEKVASACASFKGVKRRFDVRVWNDRRVYIDDYAHHPEEIKAFVSSVRAIFPEKKITGIFQPHLFSRTKDFADDFAASLSMLDELVLLDIYPAREEAIPGVTSKLIFDKVHLSEKVLIDKELLMRVLEERNPEVLLTMGAGDIDRFVEPLEEWMKKK